MKKFVFPVVMAVFLVIAAGGSKMLEPTYEAYVKKQGSSSAAIRAEIKTQCDEWIGYFGTRAPLFFDYMINDGVRAKNVVDEADVGARLKLLADGEIDFATATIDASILNSPKIGNVIDFEGFMAIVLDKSMGGDGTVIDAEKLAGVKSLGDLKGRKDIVLTYILMSPSHHLAKATAYHLGVHELLPYNAKTGKGSKFIEASTPDEVINNIESGKANVAILWQPGLSKIIHKGKGRLNGKDRYVKILGSEDTEGVIVDILLVSEKMAKKPTLVNLYLKNYFLALDKYMNDYPLMVEHVTKDLKKITGRKYSPKEIGDLLGGVEFIGLEENAKKYMNIEKQFPTYLASLVNDTVSLLMQAGDYEKNPLPDEDPFILINTDFIKTVYAEIGAQLKASAPKFVYYEDDESSISAEFEELTDEQWENNTVRVIDLPMERIVFQRGIVLDELNSDKIEAALDNLKKYSKFYLKIVGRTAPPRKDNAKNQEKFQERSLEMAEAVAYYLTEWWGVDENRIKIEGLGYSESDTEPWKRNKSEPEGAWKARNNSVKIILMKKIGL